MSSFKMTFSLASLILFIALGLVFAPISVMADDGGRTGANNNHGTAGHSNQTDANNDETAYRNHRHPTVTITLKDADTGMDKDQVYADSNGNASVVADKVGQLKFTFNVGVSGFGGSNTDVAITLFDANDTSIDSDEIIVEVEARTSTVTDPDNSNGDQVTAVTDKPAEYTLNIAINDANTTDDNTVTVASVKKLLVSVPVNAATGLGDARLRATGAQGSLVASKVFTVVQTTPAAPKVAFKVEGEASATDDFEVTFTAAEADAELEREEIEVTNGSVKRFGRDPDASVGEKTVYVALIEPDLFAETVTVTIKSSAAKAEPAAAPDDKVTVSVGEATITAISTMPADANDEADFEVIFTFNKALRTDTSLTLAHLSIGTMNSATDETKNDMMDGDEANDTVTDAKDPMFLGTPNRVPGKTMEWRVSVSPKAGANTIIGLSTAGKAKFSAATDIVPHTVMKRTAAPTAGDLTAAYDSKTMTTTISEGTIAANGFAVIQYTLNPTLPDLEYFFDIGGTITLHDDDTADDKNSRSVVMSEILWGLDWGEPLARQPIHQFIELYNTTATDQDLAGWKLVFTRGDTAGGSIPASDIDQVSNRAGISGWEVDTGDTGKSGRVKDTLATDAESAITPARIISMYRTIDYAKVEKIHDANNATENRKKQLDGFPSGNVKGSWANSELRSTNRWILSTPGKKHIKRTVVLEASKVDNTKFRINEIGNDVGGDNDWVELHNVSGGDLSLENYQLTVVTAKGTDTELFDFAGNKWTIPKDDFVVISTRHPSLTDLATGKNIAIPDADELNKGLKHLYVVKSGWNLPDSGKFTLILREAHDKEKTDTNLRDVVATAEGSFEDKGISSGIWPLKGIGKAHGEAINGAKNFAAGKVYQRESGTGRDKHNFKVAGYTGIGYDVKAAKVSSNHGTPGYANNANREMLVDADEGQIVISEIMFDRGGSERRPLPQWIEIYNSSDTAGVNLEGWKINIENIPEDDGHLLTNTFFATITFDANNAKTILPNQAVLIASSTGNVRDPNHFPPTRVVNLWTNKLHREALEMSKSTDAALSTRGFSIELVNKAGNRVDMVGNIDGDRKTRDPKPKWELPTYDAPDSPNIRSSILRIYEDGVALPDGTDKDSWILASDTVLAFDASHAYYGNADDVGSPGYRTGGPLPVSLSKFRPERNKATGEIVVRWITESELNNAGFNILRSEKRDGEFTKVHFEAGQGTTSERTVYEWKDKSAKPNVVYYYQIQDVSLDGDVTTLRVTHLRGNVTAAGKLTTTWGEIKALR